MKIYCTNEFKFEFDKLMRKNSYKNLETALVEYFFAKNLQIELNLTIHSCSKFIC